jgi:hypothetical protein
MKIAITGHTNIEKCIGIDLINNGDIYNGETFKIVYSTILSGLNNYLINNKMSLNDITFISGMARGVDEIWAAIAIHYYQPLIISVPNSVKWHKDRPPSRGTRAQAIYYDWILNYSRLTIQEIKKDYNSPNNIEIYPYANAARNQHMVDIADGVFSFKRYDSTGTDDCIKRAQKQNKYLGNL